MTKNSRVIQGAATAQRTLQFLKLLSAHNSAGLALSEIVAITGVERSAVQRALSTMVEEGFASKAVGTGRFHLGVIAMQIGFATFEHSPLREKYLFGMQRIARSSGDSVFLGMRLGDYVICLHREEGSAAIRAPRTRPGDVRVLGTTAGGLAMLSALEDAEIKEIFRKHEHAFTQARMDWKTLRERISATRKSGYARVSDNVSEGVSAIGVRLDTWSNFKTVAAIGSSTSRMTEERLTLLHSLLLSLDKDQVT